MNNHLRYRINSPKVIHQNIDGEVVVINLDTGTYYSLTESAARIWDGLQSGHNVGGLLAEMQRHYFHDSIKLEQAVAKFLGELTVEGLITISENEAAISSSNSPQSVPSERQNFVAPELKKFTDMQELLLLDPVHEVDQTGWPQQPVNDPKHARQ